MSNELTLSAQTIDGFWIYKVYDSQERLVFMFYGKLKDIISMRPFRINAKFDPKEDYKYVLVQWCGNRLDAENALDRWMKTCETPLYNIYNQTYNDKYYIQCLENGRFYRSAQDIVKIFRVSQSSVSNHLRGVTGYRHVKGLTFKFHHGERPAEIELAGGYKLQQHGPHNGHITVQSTDPINNPNLSDNEVTMLINGLLHPIYMPTTQLPMPTTPQTSMSTPRYPEMYTTGDGTWK